MSLRSFSVFVKSLQAGIFAPVVALLASVAQTLKYRSVVHVYIDKDGDWHNRRREVTFVATELHALSLSAVEDAVMDQWCYGYMLKAGDVVVDVGAGIGDDAVIFSKLVGPTGRVIAIEAHPRTFRCLLKTIQQNGLLNVVAINLAVSNNEGLVGMTDGESYQSRSIVNAGSSIEVVARRLDDILADVGESSPMLVKMNIEGAETAALLGMKKTLSLVPHIVVSCHDFLADGGGAPVLRTFNDVKTILQRSGYSCRQRPEDCRPWFRYYIYGAKCCLPVGTS